MHNSEESFVAKLSIDKSKIRRSSRRNRILSNAQNRLQLLYQNKKAADHLPIVPSQDYVSYPDPEVRPNEVKNASNQTDDSTELREEGYLPKIFILEYRIHVICCTCLLFICSLFWGNGGMEFSPFITVGILVILELRFVHNGRNLRLNAMIVYLLTTSGFNTDLSQKKNRILVKLFLTVYSLILDFSMVIFLYVSLGCLKSGLCLVL